MVFTTLQGLNNLPCLLFVVQGKFMVTYLSLLTYGVIEIQSRIYQINQKISITMVDWIVKEIASSHIHHIIIVCGSKNRHIFPS